MRIVSQTSGKTYSFVREIGSIDYEAGIVSISSFEVSSYEGDNIKIYVTPRSNDVEFELGDYFEIKSEDINIEVIGIRNA